MYIIQIVRKSQKRFFCLVLTYMFPLLLMKNSRKGASKNAINSVLKLLEQKRFVRVFRILSKNLQLFIKIFTPLRQARHDYGGASLLQKCNI